MSAPAAPERLCKAVADLLTNQLDDDEIHRLTSMIVTKVSPVSFHVSDPLLSYTVQATFVAVPDGDDDDDGCPCCGAAGLGVFRFGTPPQIVCQHCNQVTFPDRKRRS